MAYGICKLIQMIGYILTPEFSPNLNQYSSASGNQASSKKRLRGYAKAAAWILLSIGLSLALGQLN